MCGPRRKSELQLEHFFSIEQDIELHREVSYNEAMHKLVYHSIQTWIRKQRGKVIYPKTSYKTCSLSTRREAVRYGFIPDEEYPLSLCDVEQIYHNHGIKLEGECEMRQKWYPANAVPRSYYAMGGKAYHKSKNIQSTFNSLAETLTPSSKRYCVHPERLELQRHQYAYVYDLSSFTSNLHEQKAFILRLAFECREVEVIVCDAWLGYVSMSLGDMLSDYATLFEDIVVNLERVKSIYKTEYLEVEQEIASLLGIYGNITSARFLHAIVMLQTVQNERQLNTAGDDGILATYDEETPYLAICTLGKMERSKSYTTLEVGSICLKRPIYQTGQVVRVGSLVMWPSFEYPAIQEQVDPRYPQIANKTRNERCNSTAASILNFLRSITGMGLSTSERRLAIRYLSLLYTRHGFPEDGNVPQISGTGSFVCCIRGDFLGQDPVRYTITMLYTGLAAIPLRSKVPFEECMLDTLTFACNGNARTGFLTKMGYMQSEKGKVLIHGEKGLQMLIDEFSTTTPHLMQFTVLVPIPPKFRLSLDHTVTY